MTNQPRQFQKKYASIFQDASVVAAYHNRAPYSSEIFDVLAGLIDKTASPRRILDAGCGTGQMAAMLRQYADAIDAVDISTAMVETGKRMPFGADPRIHWIVGSIEEVELNPPYALIVAAASIHWMVWDVSLPRFAHVLSENGYLALVENPSLPAAWDDEVTPIVAHYSMNQDFESYNMLTIAHELEERGLFRQVGVIDTQPVLFRQPVGAWVEAIHAGNGFSRERMGVERAAEFDQQLLDIVRKYHSDGALEQWIAGRVVFGRPVA